MKIYNIINFKDHPITGAGVKMFRELCYDYGFKIYGDQQDLFCSTHPHNIFFQLLAETGTIGILIYIILSFIFSAIYLISLFSNLFVLIHDF